MLRKTILDRDDLIKLLADERGCFDRVLLESGLKLLEYSQ